jgi:hypothetical protein
MQAPTSSKSTAEAADDEIAAAHDMNIVHKILMKSASSIHEQAPPHHAKPPIPVRLTPRTGPASHLIRNPPPLPLSSVVEHFRCADD